MKTTVNCGQSSPEQIRRQRTRCWNPDCKRRAILEDYGGWKWCFKHWYLSLRWGGGNMWYYFKTTKLYWGGK